MPTNNQLKVIIKGKEFSVLNVKRPKFKPLWDEYIKIGPKKATPAYKMVGGSANQLHLKDNAKIKAFIDRGIYDYSDHAGGYQNACALRMSYGFNKGGFKIRSGTVIKNKKGESEDVYRVKGSDGLPYILKVDDLIEYLLIHFGDPEIDSDTNGQNIKNQFIGKQGIIVFKISGWDDATGHVTMWDGSQVGDFDSNNINFHDYFNFPTTYKILLWELK